ncbi:MAG: polysaccharide biosynthesis protein [Rhodocyclales bacterium]|nr:polysaccharide biosynthesis protein [Rhodocyclales bacterium]
MSAKSLTADQAIGIGGGAPPMASSNKDGASMPQRKERNNPAVAAIWFGASVYLNSALLFFATPIFTRLMSTAEYGEVTLYTSWSVVLGVFATLSLSTGIFNTAMLEFGDDLDAYISSMLGLTTLAVGGCGLVFALSVAVFGNYTGVRESLLSYMFVYFVFNAAFLFWQSRERFFFRYKAVSAISIPSSVIGVGGAIYLMLMPATAHIKVELRVAVATLPILVCGLALYAVLLKKGARVFCRKYWAYALALSIPLIPHYLAQAFLQQFDRFAIQHYLGKSSVGIYGLAMAVASGLTLFWTAINSSWVPWMLKKFAASAYDEVFQKTGILITGIGLLCVIGGLVAPEAIRLLAPPRFQEAALVTPGLLLASYFQFCQSLYLIVQFYKKRTSMITACSVLAAMLSIALNILLLPHFGVVGSSFVIAFCQAFQLVFHGWVVQRTDGLEVIARRKLMAISGSVITLSILAIACADFPLVRLPIAGVLLAYGLFLGAQQFRRQQMSRLS